MKRVLGDLSPQNVFYYFEEISAIPRGSGNTGKISNYLVEFAVKNNLEYAKDDLNNVIIIKEAGKGYEETPAIMLQGHMDMVCEKESGSSHDFLNDGLDLKINGDFIEGNETTLGGDDGIAVAYMLAILSENINCPRLECVFTVDEETGMDGAIGIDLSRCQAKYMINLDSESEGIFFAGCAGGVNVEARLKISKSKSTGNIYKLKIKGLLGGHSGDEIHKGRANAVKLAARLLCQIKKEFDKTGLVSINGGLKSNAIPRECEILFTSPESMEKLDCYISKRFDIYRAEYEVSDPDITYELEQIADDKSDIECFDEEAFERLMLSLYSTPNGVQRMSQKTPGFVETSLNLGILKTIETRENACQVFIDFSLRSSVASRKEELKEKLIKILEFAGAEIEVTGDYPGWDYNTNSKLREVMCKKWKEMFGHHAEVKTIHAGLECGILLNKMPELDIVSMGPDIHDIHTPKEKLSISSTFRNYEFLKSVITDNSLN